MTAFHATPSARLPSLRSSSRSDARCFDVVGDLTSVSSDGASEADSADSLARYTTIDDSDEMR